MSLELHKIRATARALVAGGKGILAADESVGTLTKRLESAGVEAGVENRRAYREVLFTAPGLHEYISGIILFDETLRQQTADGLSFAKVITQRGMIPGIKVDSGAKPLAGFPGETITEGLDGLRERLAEYVQLGARFTKWRAVIRISASGPSNFCCEANAHALARFAALSQESGLVPIVEPEVLMDGDHTLARHFAVTEMMLHDVFQALYAHRVDLAAMLLKPNMIVSGEDCPQQASVPEAAEATLRCLRRSVPPEVPGIVFLSGGQADIRATEHLSAINRLGPAAWALSFSFGRALQEPVLRTWRGRRDQIDSAQHALLHRARCNAAARLGIYSAGTELGDPTPSALSGTAAGSNPSRGESNA